MGCQTVARDKYFDMRWLVYFALILMVGNKIQKMTSERRQAEAEWWEWVWPPWPFDPRPFENRNVPKVGADLTLKVP